MPDKVPIAATKTLGIKKQGIIAYINDETTPEGRLLSSLSQVRTYQTGDLLLKEGDTATHILDIATGTVSVSRHGVNGRRQVLGFVGARQFLGAASTPRYPNSVTALTSVQALAYPKDAFSKALDASALFSQKFRDLLVKIIEARDDHIYTIGQRVAFEQIAAFLLHLRIAQAGSKMGDHGGTLDLIKLPMVRSDIGDYLGLTVETVSRAFSQLKQIGIIHFSDSHECEILDIDRLKAIGGRDDFTERRGAL